MTPEPITYSHYLYTYIYLIEIICMIYNSYSSNLNHYIQHYYSY
jgi:hypothetical protein